MAVAYLLVPTVAPSAQTLQDALVEAYMRNPDLAAEQAALRAKDTRVPQARAGFYPNLSATLQRQWTRGDGKSAFVFPSEPGVDLEPYEEILETQDANSTIATLTLKQNIYAGGGTSAALAKAETQVRAGRANLLSVEQTVLLNATDAYVATWRDRRLMDEASLNLERMSSQLTATRRRLELGEVARTDLAQAEAARARAQADSDQASANLAASEATYERVIGPITTSLDDPHAILDLPRRLEDAYRMVEANPDVARATMDLAAARADVDVASAGLLPSIDLAGQLNYSDDPNPTYVHQKSAQVGITLTVPLFQGGSVTAKVREANQTVQQRKSQLDSVSDQIRQEVRKSWTAIVAARSAVESYRLEADSNALALQGVEREGSLGLRTVLDILNAQYALFQSRANLFRAQADAVNASYKLKAAVGQLTVADLGLAVEPYDPATNYREERWRLFGLDGVRP